jgi:hypothetical protein
LYWNFILNTGWSGIKPTYWKLSIWYFAIQNTSGAISRKYQNISFFLLLSVSDRFKPIVPFCVRVYPLKWHETEYFSVKPVKIWDYVLGKRYETKYFSVKLVENWEYVLGKQYETEYLISGTFSRIVIFISSCIVSISNHILSVSCTDFAISPMPASYALQNNLH